MASQFRNPDFAAFESRFGCQIPPALLRLYELGEPLMDSPGEVRTGDDGLWIQEFHPLTDERVGLWGMYGWKFFAFAIGGESQTYLISIEDPTHVFVDYESEVLPVVLEEARAKTPALNRPHRTQISATA